MIIPVRCISCGKPIAQLYEQYKDKTKNGEDPKKTLDELGLKRYCCRSMFISHVDLVEEVGKFKKD